MNLSSFPIFRSGRVRLRALNATDNSILSVLRSDTTVNRYLDRAKNCSLPEASAFILKIQQSVAQNKSLYWAITTTDSDDLIGTICLWNFSEDETRAEIGYELLPAWQGRGLMQEAVKTVIDYCFSVLRLTVIIAMSGVGNMRSSGLLKRFDFLPDTDRRMANEAESAGCDIFYLQNPGGLS